MICEGFGGGKVGYIVFITSKPMVWRSFSGDKVCYIEVITFTRVRNSFSSGNYLTISVEDKYLIIL